MDYKKKIIDAIRELGEKDYDGKDLLNDSQTTLMLKFYSLKECLCEKAGTPVEPIRVDTGNGKVKEFKNVDELAIYISENQGIIKNKSGKSQEKTSARRIRRRV